MQKLLLKTVLVFSIILLFAAFGESANAQPRKAKERICQMKKMKLLQILDLSDAKADKFITAYSSFERRIDEKRREMDEASAEIRRLHENKTGKSEMKGLSDKYIAAQKELFKLVDERNAEMKNLLDDSEFAKFLAFENEFPKEIQKMIFKKRRGRQGE